VGRANFGVYTARRWTDLRTGYQLGVERSPSPMYNGVPMIHDS